MSWFTAWRERRAMKRRWKEEARQLAKEREHRQRVAELRAEAAAESARAAGLRLKAEHALWSSDEQDALKRAADAEAKAARARVLMQHYAEMSP